MWRFINLIVTNFDFVIISIFLIWNTFLLLTIMMGVSALSFFCVLMIKFKILALFQFNHWAFFSIFMKMNMSMLVEKY